MKCDIVCTGDVNFTDPLMVQFQSKHLKSKKKTGPNIGEYDKHDGLVKNLDDSDSVWFAKSSSTFLL